MSAPLPNEPPAQVPRWLLRVLVALAASAILLAALGWALHIFSPRPTPRPPVAVVPLPLIEPMEAEVTRAKVQFEDAINLKPDAVDSLKHRGSRGYFDGIQDELALPKDERIKPERLRLPDTLKQLSPYHPYSREQSAPGDGDRR